MELFDADDGLPEHGHGHGRPDGQGGASSAGALAAGT